MRVFRLATELLRPKSGRNEFGCFALEGIGFLDTGSGGLPGARLEWVTKGERT
jgi:hypothetical protein